MKGLLAILLVTLSLFFSACGGDDDSSDKNDDSGNNNEKTSSRFDKLEEGLKENNINFTRSTKNAAQIEAKEGYGYELTDDPNFASFEVYLFDTNSEAYKKIEETGTITINVSGGMEIPAEINNGLAIMFIGSPKDKAKILEIFNSI